MIRIDNIDNNLINQYNRFHLEVINVLKDDEALEIELKELPKEVMCCPKCSSKAIKSIGLSRLRRFKDITEDHKLATLRVSKVNYKCLDCESIFNQENDLFYNKNLTTRMKSVVMYYVKNTNLNNCEIGRQLGFDEKSIRRFRKELELSVQKEAI
jgi:hypothetical protein